MSCCLSSFASATAPGAEPVPDSDKRNALDHVVVVLFENRSFDNVLVMRRRNGKGSW